MESEVAEIFIDDIDVDSMLQGFPQDYDHDLDLWLSNSLSYDPNSPRESETPTDLSLFAEEIEKFLMDDAGGDQGEVGDGGDKHLDDFLAGVLVDGSSSHSGRSEVASPESRGSVETEEGKEVVDGAVAIDGEEREEEEEAEQISKKRRRQMRNRESAMQSRERKKLYVKEIEMKSKYLESECQRLDYALRCCMAENFALNQRLQLNDAPAAKQESAVLFMESLLLGSLFWLVSIVCLSLLPGLQILNPKDASRLGGRGLTLEVVVSRTVPSKRVQPDFGFDLVIMRRRYIGLRPRMKSFLFPFHYLSAGVFWAVSDLIRL